MHGQGEKGSGENLFAGRADTRGSLGSEAVLYPWALFHGNRDSFTVNGAGDGNLLTRLSAVANINAHGLEDALFGIFNCLA